MFIVVRGAVVLALFAMFLLILGLVSFIEGPNRHHYEFQTGVCYAMKGTELLNDNGSYTCIVDEKIIFKKTLQEAQQEQMKYISK